MTNPKIYDLRLFLGIWAAIFAVFLTLGFYKDGELRVWAAVLLGAAMILQLYPRASLPLYIAQVKIGSLLGFCISRTILFLLFFLIFCPIGLFFKIIGRDALRQKQDVKSSSYFIMRDKQPTSMKNQF